MEKVTCPLCGGAVPPRDAAEAYCPHCRWWTLEVGFHGVLPPHWCDWMRGKRAHEPHEWFESPPVLRRECPGYPLPTVRPAPF